MRKPFVVIASMPAEKFGFKPTPEQMSFREILAHEAEPNETLCSFD